jgi:hypothetical protein
VQSFPLAQITRVGKGSAFRHASGFGDLFVGLASKFSGVSEVVIIDRAKKKHRLEDLKHASKLISTVEHALPAANKA